MHEFCGPFMKKLLENHVRIFQAYIPCILLTLDHKVFWLLHIYLLWKISIQKSSCNIHLMHLEIFNGYNCKHNSNWFHLCNGERGFIIINSFNLCKSHQMNLVPCHKAIGIIFDLEDPFATHWSVTKWMRSKYPSLIVL
jgi:hypothetical protein